jgi:rSAM/selenodomain-associated transferase 1
MTPGAPRPEAGVRIAVFAKAPVPGEVKTRLVPLLGPEGAAALHSGLVRLALSTAALARLGPVELWCTPDEKHPFFERCASEFNASLHRQEGPDLGARMLAAFARATPLVLIGSDCPSLGVPDLQEAARALDEGLAAVSPAEDGGYVLIALPRPHPALFEGVGWGTSAVMAQTRARLAELRIKWRELPARWDVDRPDDYARLQREGRLEEVLS